MKVKLEKAFEFRAPTAAEINDARASEDRELDHLAQLRISRRGSWLVCRYRE